jgi:hypothetical protein
MLATTVNEYLTVYCAASTDANIRDVLSMNQTRVSRSFKRAIKLMWRI